MKVRMLTTAAGPNDAANWQAGDIRNVSKAEAAALIAARYAIAVDDEDKAEIVASPPPEVEVAAAPVEAETAEPHRTRRSRRASK